MPILATSNKGLELIPNKVHLKRVTSISREGTSQSGSIDLSSKFKSENPNPT